MHFGFALDSLDIDFWKIDLLDTHLDLLDTNIPSKYFVCLQNVLKTSSKHVFKTSSRRLQGSNFFSSKPSSRRLCKMSSRHLKTSCRTKNCYAEEVFKKCPPILWFSCITLRLKLFLIKKSWNIPPFFTTVIYLRDQN